MDAEMLLLELYKEENTHARHTETQRLEVTKFLLGLAGVFVAFMGTLKFSIYCLPFGFLIMALGYMARAITRTYVQRFDDHRKRARAIRAKLDSVVNPPGLASPIISANPMVKGVTGDDRVRTFWIKISLAVIALGAVCVVCNLIAISARAYTRPCGTSLLHRICDQLSGTV